MVNVRNNTQRQDQELLVWICEEERRRTCTEESPEDGYASEKEERTTENKKDACQRDLKSAGLEQARRWTGRHGVGRSSVISATLDVRKSRGKEVDVIIELNNCSRACGTA